MSEQQEIAISSNGVHHLSRQAHHAEEESAERVDVADHRSAVDVADLRSEIDLADHRSEEVTEIIGKMPSWLIRRGISLTGIILLSIGIAAWFFTFPDVIASKIVISSGNPPIKLVARSSLPIQLIFVHNDEQVTAGQALCVLANSAVYGDISQINTLITLLDTSRDLAASLFKIKIPGALQLGDLQGGYTDLCVAIQGYVFFITHNTYQAAIGSLTKQVSYNGQLQKELSSKQGMLQEQLSLQQNRFAADSSLVTDKIIAPLEYEESKKKMLDQQMSMGNNNSSIIQNNLQQIGYRKDIAQLTLQKLSEENNLQQKVKDAVRRLKGLYAQWQQSYVVSSPANGKVTFFKFWKENQYVTAGEGLMMVIPPMLGYIVHGTVGVENTGKIKVGQQVILKLPAYPFEEYGVLEGTVTGRSIVAMDGNFSLEIKLDNNNLTTNTGKIIPPQPELEAMGEILTQNKSILQRLFERILGNRNDRR